MNQCKAIVDYMREHGSISNNEAVIKLGIGRLQARISDLRSAGHLYGLEEGEYIETTMTEFENKYTGRKGKYAEYSIVKAV